MATEPVDHRRAVAERNVGAILDAAEQLLEEAAPTSIAAVAPRAGVSRPTVYAHYATREVLLEAVVERAVTRAAAAFDEATANASSATDALMRAVTSSWIKLSRHTAIAQAAAAQLSGEVLRRTHEGGLSHIRRMVDRGRETGEFRTDVPAEWLVSVFHALLHVAGDDVRAGRLENDTALDALTATLLSAFTPD